MLNQISSFGMVKHAKVCLSLTVLEAIVYYISPSYLHVRVLCFSVRAWRFSYLTSFMYYIVVIVL